MNILPELAKKNNEQKQGNLCQNEAIKIALRQLQINTQLLKKVYGIPDMSFVFQQNNQGALFLGNFFAAQNVEELKKNEISAVLTVAQQLPIYYDKHLNIQHLVIQALDAEYQNLSQYFDQTNTFIDQNLVRNKNILIHCAAGVSRSATCTIAYIMFKKHWTLDLTLSKVRQQRKIVNPNPGFMKQLKQYEVFLKMKKKIQTNS